MDLNYMDLLHWFLLNPGPNSIIRPLTKEITANASGEIYYLYLSILNESHKWNPIKITLTGRVFSSFSDF